MEKSLCSIWLDVLLGERSLKLADNAQGVFDGDDGLATGNLHPGVHGPYTLFVAGNSKPPRRKPIRDHHSIPEGET